MTDAPDAPADVSPSAPAEETPAAPTDAPAADAPAADAPATEIAAADGPPGSPTDITPSSPSSPPGSPSGKLQTTLACRGVNKRYRLMVPPTITIGDFLALVSARTERTDLRHVWVDGRKVRPPEIFGDNYTGGQLYYLTDTDFPPTDAELLALGLADEEVSRASSRSFRRMTIELKPLDGPVVNITTNADGTVDDLKYEITQLTGLPLDTRLILPVKGADGKTQTVAELIEGHDLTEYGLEEGARVHQALKLKPVTI